MEKVTGIPRCPAGSTKEGPLPALHPRGQRPAGPGLGGARSLGGKAKGRGAAAGARPQMNEPAASPRGRAGQGLGLRQGLRKGLGLAAAAPSP